MIAITLNMKTIDKLHNMERSSLVVSSHISHNNHTATTNSSHYHAVIFSTYTIDSIQYNYMQGPWPAYHI